MKRLLLTYLVLLFAFAVHAQDRVVSGKVTSTEDGSAIPGANVVLKGTSNGTVTNADGGYRLNVPASGGVLVFSFIGMTTSEETIGERSVIDLGLNADVKQLNEVIVTSMGLKEDPDKFGSSISTVKGTNIAKSGETGVLQGLAGKTAGVLITRSGGDPGAGAYIQIRGQNTINGNSQPLFIVDGVPISNSNEGNSATGNTLAGAGNSIVQQSRVNDINPDDIASMEVLKGASAAALWGTRAANGVIIITTKKGSDSKGKVNISFKSTVSFDQVNKMHELQTTYGGGTDGHYIQGNRESWGDKISDRKGGDDTNILGAGFVTFPDGTKRYPIAAGSGVSLDGTGAAAHGGKNSTATYDHKTDPFQTGHFLDNNLTISGGNAKTNFLISYSNLNQEGVIKSFSDYKRNSARVNVSSQFTDWFRASASVAYVNTYSTRAQGGDNVDGLLLGGLRTSPDFDNTQYTGSYTTAGGEIKPDRHVSFRNPLGASDGPRYSNPLWNIHNNKNTTDVDRIIGNLELALDPTSWLNVTGRVGIDNFTDHNNEKFPLYSASFPTGYLQRNITTESQLNTDLFARTSKTFGSNFTANLLVGVNYNNRQRETVHTQITNFIIPSAPDLLTNALNSNLQAFNYRNQIRTFAYYAQADLQAYDMFYLTLTGRQESASTYANSFFFPSAALAWQFTKLSALKDNSFLSFGKLRLSWGQVGIQPQPYLNITQFNPTFYGDSYAYGLAAISGVYGGGFTRSSLLGNPNLKPEVKTEMEVGTDLRFLNNRLTVSATAYTNQTTDVILTLGLSYVGGYANQNLNAAKLENKGVEVEIGYDVLTKGAFKWNLSGNMSINRNKVVSLGGTDAQPVPGNGAYGGQSLIEGQPFGVFYGTDFLKKTDGSGKYDLDANGFPQPGVSNEVMGNPNPSYRAGIGSTFSYKGVSLYVLFDRVYGNDYWNGTRGALYTFGTHLDNGYTVTSPTALKDFDGNTIPANTPFRGQIKDFGNGPVALTQSWYKGYGTSFNGASAKQFVEDGGSTRLREITMSYSLRSAGFRAATKLSSIDFSLTGRNLFLWTNYRGVDPDTNISGASVARGSDWFTNPSTKSILFTVKITY
jgi:TonB-linked SusC/RagA family outer membrane protein